MDTLQVVFVATNQLLAQLIVVLPKLIISLVIWYLGRYLLNVAGKLLKNIDIQGTKIEEGAVETLAVLINGVGTIILVLIILDYLGIGSSVVASLAQSVTLAIAIALGLAFGRALEQDAKNVLISIKEIFAPKHNNWPPISSTKRTKSRFSKQK